jgi:hypothetical protein
MRAWTTFKISLEDRREFPLTVTALILKNEESDIHFQALNKDAQTSAAIIP